MDRRILSFLTLAFGFSWLVAGAGAALGIDAASGTAYVVLAGTCMFGPSIAAVVQARWIDGAGWEPLGIHVKRFPLKPILLTVLVGVCIVPAILLCLLLCGALFPEAGFGEVNFTNEGLIGRVKALMAELGQGEATEEQLGPLRTVPPALVLVGALMGAVGAACTVNLPFMLGEELGWRGYLWHRTAQWTGLRRVLFTGAVWGLWHAPLIAMGHNYQGHPVAGIGLMVLFCMVLALLFDWTRWRSGSVWSSALLHGIINGSAGALALFAAGGHPLVGSAAGAGGIIAIAVLGGIVVAVDGRYRQVLFGPPSPSAAVIVDRS